MNVVAGGKTLSPGYDHACAFADLRADLFAALVSWREPRGRGSIALN
jgi:hypothetical protein